MMLEKVEKREYDTGKLSKSVSLLGRIYKRKTIRFANSVVRACKFNVNIRRSFYEYRVLRLQGFSRSESLRLIEEFEKGNNPGGKFVFHFTTRKGAKAITSSGKLKVGKHNKYGRGIYAGVTPTPSKLIVYGITPGWGIDLWRRLNYRIPILVTDDIKDKVEVVKKIKRAAAIRMEELRLAPMDSRYYADGEKTKVYHICGRC